MLFCRSIPTQTIRFNNTGSKSVAISTPQSTLSSKSQFQQRNNQTLKPLLPTVNQNHYHY
jgi:hypothetical protein